MQDTKNRSAQDCTPEPTGRADSTVRIMENFPSLCPCRPALIITVGCTEVAHAAGCEAGR